jgi:hypothetical protein
MSEKLLMLKEQLKTSNDFENVSDKNISNSSNFALFRMGSLHKIRKFWKKILVSKKTI